MPYVSANRLLARLRTAGGPPPAPPVRAALLAGLGGFSATLAMFSLADWSGAAFVMAPFGASCVLAFALPESPLSQPRNIIGGHLIATGIGLAMMSLFGTSAAMMALAVGLAIAAMLATRTTHAPAGANPLLVMLAGADWSFLVTPVLAGAVTLVCVAFLYHRCTGRSDYPRYWL